MLDFSFTEIGLVGLVALIAIGPERMPKVARGAGVLFGRFRRYTQSVKAEIDRELLQSEMKEVERKIAEARDEAARQIAASTAAVDGILKQPVLTRSDLGSAVPSVVNPPVRLVESSALAAVDGFLANEAPYVPPCAGAERPNVGYALFGGDPFSVRRGAPSRSLAREITSELSVVKGETE